MIPQPHSATVIIQTKDKFGTITASEEKPFDCLVQQGTQYDYIGGQVVAMGKGVVFTTTSSIAFVVGMPLLYGGATYMIKKVSKLEGIEGDFSHYELLYA
jgi:hypothetical protein